MLVLSRQRDEVIIIGEGEDAVRVKVVDIRGDKVRLGFEAPRSVKIHREEVYNAIQREKAGEAESGVVEVVEVLGAVAEATVEVAGEVLGAVLEGLD